MQRSRDHSMPAPDRYEAAEYRYSAQPDHYMGFPVDNAFNISFDDTLSNDYDDMITSYARSDNARSEYTTPQLFHSSTFPPQPTISLSESTPITPSHPSQQFPDHKRTPSQDQLWSPASSHPPATPFSRERARSLPGPSDETPTQQLLTPELQHRQPSLSPPCSRDASPARTPPVYQTPDPSTSTPLKRMYTPIAPNPVGLLQMNALKRSYSEENLDWPSLKRHKSEGPELSSPQVELSDEDQLLLRLKDEEGLSWKDIQTRFSDDMGKQFQVPALQMRLKRLRERLRVWTEGDLQALRLAHDYWLNQKFEIISSKMLEFGSTERWSGKQCSRKWQELCWTPDSFGQQYNNGMGMGQAMLRTPTFSTQYTASPVEGQNPLGFYMSPMMPISTSY